MLMEGLAGILLELGGPVLAKAIGRKLGDDMGRLAQDALDTLGKVFGVDGNEEDVRAAIEAEVERAPDAARAKVTLAESEMASVLLAQAQVMAQGNVQQRQTNELLMAQAKEPGWRSAWLYIWQYFLIGLWGWTIVLVPVLNAALRIFATNTSTDLITGQLLTEAPSIWAPELGLLFQLNVLYLGLHMGGHTVLEIVRNGLGGVFGKGKAD